MAQSTTKTATQRRTRFVVHQNAQGYWVASEQGGLIKGIFRVERDALHFALSRLRPGIGHRHNAASKPR